MRKRQLLVIILGVCLASSSVVHAGILGQIRDSISSLWGQSANKRHQARAARTKASALTAQANSLHDRLEATQQALQVANSNYYNYWSQMRRTEAQISSTSCRRTVVTARYNRRRRLFGRRLAAMQRSGQLSYLQMFLGSRTLSDLTRRAYLYDTLTEHDAQLQAGLKSDKQELEAVQRLLAQEWHKRSGLQLIANRERERITRASTDQQRMLYQINSSRYEMLAYSQAQEQSSREIGDMIGDLEHRRASIIQSYEEQAARERPAPRYRERRYRRRRVARRVTRVRMVQGEGGILKPMSISQLEFHTEVVPAENGPIIGGTVRDGSPGNDVWKMPVNGRISSGFGNRYHPILHRRKLHTGDDLAASYGTPFSAAHNGRVLWSGWKKAYGNTIIIDDGDGTTSLYGHASKLGVRAGQPVKAGEYIGNVGSTGWSTGPHLHFEVRKKGQPVNPTPYLHRH